MAGDFQSLWRLHAPRVYRHCLRELRSSDAAEEVSHRVAMRAWRSFERLRDHDAALKWLLRIADRQILNYLRMERRAAARHRKAREVSERRPDSPAQGHALPDLSALIRAAEQTGALADGDAQVLLLRARMLHASWEAVGRHLGLSDRGAAKRHVAAIRRLQVFLVLTGQEMVGGAGSVAWAIERARLSGEERVVIGKCLAARSGAFLANREAAALVSACSKILRVLDGGGLGRKI